MKTALSKLLLLAFLHPALEPAWAGGPSHPAAVAGAETPAWQVDAAIDRSRSLRLEGRWLDAEDALLDAMFAYGRESAKAAFHLAEHYGARAARAVEQSVKRRLLAAQFVALGQGVGVEEAFDRAHPENPDWRTRSGAELTERPTPPLGAVLPLRRGVVTQGYGRHHGTFHSGVDVATRDGEPLLAVGAGVVVRTARERLLGCLVEIRYESGLRVVHGHMQPELWVRPDQTVRAGTPLGRLGNTGTSSGPHVHLEVRLPDGNLVDPATVFTGLGAFR